MRILLIGKSGQVGSALAPLLRNFGETMAVGRDACDLEDPSSIRATVREARPDAIVNAAAFTNVNAAESARELANQINAIAPGILAAEAKQMGALLIHYSTDYVFDGTKREPYLESDPVNPLNVYGATKLAGEAEIQQVGGEFLILRTSWVYGPSGSNFMRTMLKLAQEKEQLSIVRDQVGAPTSSLEIAAATMRLLDVRNDAGGIGERSGIYHLTATGSVSWHGFALEILEQAARRWGSRVPVLTPVLTADYPTVAKRPLNSRLSNDKLKAAFGIQLSDWKSALQAVLDGSRYRLGRRELSDFEED